jgi:hypothetical protein
MACVLTSGRTEPCLDAVAGLKAAWFIDWVEDAFTIASSEASAINAAVTAAYKYELRANGNTYNETSTADAETGTTTYEQSLSLSLKKQGLASAKEIFLLHKSRPIVVVQFRNGDYRIMGHTDGVIATGDIQSGGSKTEFNGYNLTFTSVESQPAPYLDSATKTAFIALLSATNIDP